MSKAIILLACRIRAMTFMACLVAGAGPFPLMASDRPGQSTPGSPLPDTPGQKLDEMLRHSEDHPLLTERYRGLWSTDQLPPLLSKGHPTRGIETLLEESEDLPQLRRR